MLRWDSYAVVTYEKAIPHLVLVPRPKNPWIRELFPNLRIQYVTDHENHLLTRITELNFQTFASTSFTAP